MQTQLGFLYGCTEYPIDKMTKTELVRKVQLCQHALDTIGKVNIWLKMTNLHIGVFYDVLDNADCA